MPTLTLKNVRLSYPHLDTPRGSDRFPDMAPRYSASFIIDKKDEATIKQIETAALEAIRSASSPAQKNRAEQFWNQWKTTSLKSAFTEGEPDKVTGDPADHFVLRANRKPSDGAPNVRSTKNTTVRPGDAEYPYAGCYVNAKVDIWAQNGTYSGVRCTLIGVQFLRDGQAFGGSPRPSENDFESLSSENDSDLDFDNM